MSIVMGLDQHRAQITAEWLDTETGEVSRVRVTPADRAGVRRFLTRFAGQRLEVLTAANRGWLAGLALPDAAREQVMVALAMIDALDDQSAAISAELRRYARRRAGCRALMGLYGVGELTAVAILAELGDTRRFSSSRQAVRCAGLDITVHQSDQRRSPGHLSRQGPPALRWALYEAAQAAQRLGGNRACLALARKLLKRSFHVLRELGDQALAPA